MRAYNDTWGNGLDSYLPWMYDTLYPIGLTRNVQYALGIFRPADKRRRLHYVFPAAP